MRAADSTVRLMISLKRYIKAFILRGKNTVLGGGTKLRNGKHRELSAESDKGSWVIGVIILSLGWFLLYATRTALSSALKDIGDFWSLSEGFLGLLSSSFFFSYAALQVPSGALADKVGSCKMIVVGFIVQAIGLLLGVLSQSPFQFLLARVLTGAGQAPYFACQQAILYFILPKDKLARGIAMTTAGAGLGSAGGFVLGKFLSASSLGWKMPFVILTFFAAGYALLVTVVIPEPPKEAADVEWWDSEKDVGAALEEKAKTIIESKPAALSDPNPAWRVKFLIFLAASHFLTMYGFNLILTWLPYYLETVRQFAGALSASIPLIMPLIMAPSAILWGIAADKQKNRDFVIWICLPIAGFAIAAIPGLHTPAYMAAALVFYGMTGKLVFDPMMVAEVSENAPAKNHGVFLAAFNFAGALSMVIAPSMTGFIAERTGSFDISFFAAGAFHLAGLVSFIYAKHLLKMSRSDALEEVIERF